MQRPPFLFGLPQLADRLVAGLTFLLLIPA